MDTKEDVLRTFRSYFDCDAESNANLVNTLIAEFDGPNGTEQKLREEYADWAREDGSEVSAEFCARNVCKAMKSIVQDGSASLDQALWTTNLYITAPTLFEKPPDFTPRRHALLELFRPQLEQFRPAIREFSLGELHTFRGISADPDELNRAFEVYFRPHIDQLACLEALGGILDDLNHLDEAFQSMVLNATWKQVRAESVCCDDEGYQTPGDSNANLLCGNEAKPSRFQGDVIFWRLGSQWHVCGTLSTRIFQLLERQLQRSLMPAWSVESVGEFPDAFAFFQHNATFAPTGYFAPGLPTPELHRVCLADLAEGYRAQEAIHWHEIDLPIWIVSANDELLATLGENAIQTPDSPWVSRELLKRLDTSTISTDGRRRLRKKYPYLLPVLHEPSPERWYPEPTSWSITDRCPTLTEFVSQTLINAPSEAWWSVLLRFPAESRDVFTEWDRIFESSNDASVSFSDKYRAEVRRSHWSTIKSKFTDWLITDETTETGLSSISQFTDSKIQADIFLHWINLGGSQASQRTRLLPLHTSIRLYEYCGEYAWTALQSKILTMTALKAGHSDEIRNFASSLTNPLHAAHIYRTQGYGGSQANVKRAQGDLRRLIVSVLDDPERAVYREQIIRHHLYSPNQGSRYAPFTLHPPLNLKFALSLLEKPGGEHALFAGSPVARALELDSQPMRRIITRAVERDRDDELQQAARLLQRIVQEGVFLDLSAVRKGVGTLVDRLEWDEAAVERALIGLMADSEEIPTPPGVDLALDKHLTTLVSRDWLYQRCVRAGHDLSLMLIDDDLSRRFRLRDDRLNDAWSDNDSGAHICLTAACDVAEKLTDSNAFFDFVERYGGAVVGPERFITRVAEWPQNRVHFADGHEPSNRRGYDRGRELMLTKNPSPFQKLHTIGLSSVFGVGPCPSNLVSSVIRHLVFRLETAPFQVSENYIQTTHKYVLGSNSAPENDEVTPVIFRTIIHLMLRPYSYTQQPPICVELLEWITTTVWNERPDLMAKHLTRLLSETADPGFVKGVASALTALREPVGKKVPQALNAVRERVKRLGDEDLVAFLTRQIGAFNYDSVAQEQSNRSVAVRMSRALARLDDAAVRIRRLGSPSRNDDA